MTEELLPKRLLAVGNVLGVEGMMPGCRKGTAGERLDEGLGGRCSRSITSDCHSAPCEGEGGEKQVPWRNRTFGLGRVGHRSPLPGPPPSLKNGPQTTSQVSMEVGVPLYPLVPIVSPKIARFKGNLHGLIWVEYGSK